MLKKGEHLFIPFDAYGKQFHYGNRPKQYKTIEAAEAQGFHADTIVEYAPVRHGRWVLQPGGTMYKCSQCGYTAHPREADEWLGCPSCLAKMKGGESDA